VCRRHPRILIPPSVLLILYGATASVSVVQLYAGAFFRLHAVFALYRLHHRFRKDQTQSCAAALEEDQRVDLPKSMEIISKTRNSNALIGLIGEIKGKRNADIRTRTLISHLIIVLLPLFAAALLVGLIYFPATAPEQAKVEGVQEMGFAAKRRQRKQNPILEVCRNRRSRWPERTTARSKARNQTGSAACSGSRGRGPKMPAEAKPAEPAAPAARPVSARPFLCGTGSRLPSTSSYSLVSIRFSASNGLKSSRCC